MKDILIAVAAMIVIIAAQKILTSVFTYQVGETFSRIALSFLFYYAIMRGITSKKKAVN